LLEKSVVNEIEQEWRNIKTCIYKAAEESLGKKFKRKKPKRLRIWNEGTETAIQEKKKAYLTYLQKRTPSAEEKYKEKRNIAKKVVRQAHQQSWEKFISETEHDIHRRQQFTHKIMKHLNQEKDIAKMNTIQENQWIEHYKSLWSDQEENDQDISINNQSEDENLYIDAIILDELKNTLKNLKNQKAPGLDKINVELIKYGGLILELQLLHLINECWNKHQIPLDWNTAEVISLFKKGDCNKCANYRGISLLNSTYKVYSKIIDERVKSIAEALLKEEQSDFRKGRSCNDNIFIVKRMIEKRRKFNLETHIAFVDFEKASD
jgi:hypothetical protein